MIKDNQIIVLNDALTPFYFPQEYVTQIPGYYLNSDPQLNDVVIIEIPNKPNNNELNVTWKLRLVLGLPGDIFTVKNQAEGNLFELYKNGSSLLNPLNFPYLLTLQDLISLHFNKNIRECKNNEYFVWSSKVSPFNDFYKGGFVHKKYITGKVLGRYDKYNYKDPLTFNTSNFKV